MNNIQTSIVVEETWVEKQTEKLQSLPTATSARELDVSTIRNFTFTIVDEILNYSENSQISRYDECLNLRQVWMWNVNILCAKFTDQNPKTCLIHPKKTWTRKPKNINSLVHASLMMKPKQQNVVEMNTQYLELIGWCCGWGLFESWVTYLCCNWVRCRTNEAVK